MEALGAASRRRGRARRGGSRGDAVVRQTVAKATERERLCRRDQPAAL
jgi:hypothetical protein